MRWWHKAANTRLVRTSIVSKFEAMKEQSIITAQFYLGEAYRVGDGGVQEDDAMAIEWYTKVAPA